MPRSKGSALSFRWPPVVVIALLVSVGLIVAEGAVIGTVAAQGLAAKDSPPPASAEAGVLVALEGVRFSGTSVFADETLQELVSNAIGSMLTFAELDQLATRVTRFYRQQGYPVARAYLPAQTISGGTIEIRILEGHFGEIRLINESALREEVAQRRIGALAPGDIIEQTTLDRTLLLLNDLPGVEVVSSLEPGVAAGEAHLVVRLADVARRSGRVSLDNGGNAATGTGRGQLALGYDNPFGLGDSFTFNGQLTEGSLLSSARVGYAVPIGRQLTLETSVSAVQYTLGSGFAVLDTSGGSVNVDLALLYPWQRSSGRTQVLLGRLNMQNTYSEIESDRIKRQSTALSTAFRNQSNTARGIISYSLQLTSGTLEISPAAAKSADAASAQTQGWFTKLDADFNYVQRLSARTQWSIAARGQWAGKNLTDSAKLPLGGSNGVRAYPSGEASGDAGVLVTLDIAHAPRLTDRWPGAWRVNAFVDAGTVKINAAPWTGADVGSRALFGAGFGLLFVHADRYSANVEYACRLGNEPLTSTADEPCQLWLRAGAAF